MKSELGGDSFTHDQIKEYLWKTLKGGQVVPGYAHLSLQISWKLTPIIM
jgi:citrate synthase